MKNIGVCDKYLSMESVIIDKNMGRVKTILLILALLGSVFYFGLSKKRIDLFSLFDSRIPDDSLYYLKTAKNYAEGNGSTFDGTNLTNGYQPLWFWTIVGLYKSNYLKGKNLVTDFYRAIYFQCIINAFTYLFLFLFFLELFENKYFAFLLSIYLALIFSKVTINLLETPLLQVFFAMFLWVTFKFFIKNENPEINQSKSLTLILGTVVALSFLARIDSLALIVPLALLLFFYKRNWFLVCVPVFITSLLYFYLNKISFGVPTPVSGTIKSYASINLFFKTSFWEFIRNKIVLFVSPWEYYSPEAKLKMELVAFSVIPLFYLRQKSLKKPIYDFFLMIGTFFLIKYTFYSFVFTKYTMIPYWYWVSSELWLKILLVYFAWQLFFWLFSEKKGVRFCKQAAIIILGLFCLGNMIKGVHKNFYKQVKFFQTRPHIDTSYMLELAFFLNSPFFENKKIGAFNSGIIGYFSGKQVTNLDGLINSPKYCKNVVLPRKFGDYIRQEDFDVIAEVISGQPCEYEKKYDLVSFREYVGTDIEPLKIGSITYDYSFYVNKKILPEIIRKFPKLKILK